METENIKPKHLKIVDLMKLSVRAFKVRPTRTLLTILGMSVGIGTVFFLISLGYGLQNILVGKLAPNEDSLKSLEVYYPGDGQLTLTRDVIAGTAAMPGVVRISPVAELSGDMDLDSLAGSIVMKVVDENYFNMAGQSVDVGSDDVSKGFIISSSALKLLGKAPDATVLNQNAAVTFQAGDASDAPQETTPTLPIVGIINDDNSVPYVYIDAKDITYQPTSFVRFFALASDYNRVDTLRTELVNQGFIISARIDVLTQARRITTAITIVLAVFGTAALIVSAIGMFNTMLISFMERIFEVGIMKSIGATSSDIRNLFLMESLIVGILGGVGGLLIGYLAGQIFNLGLNILAHYLGGQSVSLFAYPLSFILLIIVLSGIVGVVSGLWPARQAAKLSAREAFLRK